MPLYLCINTISCHHMLPLLHSPIAALMSLHSGVAAFWHCHTLILWLLMLCILALSHPCVILTLSYSCILASFCHCALVLSLPSIITFPHCCALLHQTHPTLVFWGCWIIILLFSYQAHLIWHLFSWCMPQILIIPINTSPPCVTTWHMHCLLIWNVSEFCTNPHSTMLLYLCCGRVNGLLVSMNGKMR